MEKKIKVILSTFGPLHLIKSAEYLSSLVDIKIIQGWIPSWWNKWILFFLDKKMGYKLTKTIKKRTPACLKNNIGIGFPEFYLWLLRFYFHSDKSNIQAAHIYGKLSKRYIKDADIFHVRSGSGLSGAIEKARKEGMKIVVDHSIAHPAFMRMHLKEEFEKNGATFDLGDDNEFWKGVLSDCNKADILLVNSYFVRDTFIQQGYPSEKIRVAYLGVRSDFFALKQTYEINDRFQILFTGGFGFRKGAEYIFKALTILERRNIPYEFIVVGNNSEGKMLMGKYPLQHVKFVGFIPQDELKEYLAKSDIYLFPSLCEGCASSGMEAMAAGLPVIATKESGLPITNMKNGIIVPSKDEKSIVDAIIKLYQDHLLREALGKESAKMIEHNYTWQKYAMNVYSIYNKLTNND